MVVSRHSAPSSTVTGFGRGGWLRSQVLGLVGLVATLGTASCTGGISSGIDYPDVGEVELDKLLQTPEGDSDPSVTLSRFKFAPKACEGIDTRVAVNDLDQEDLTRFFAARGIEMKPRKARGDLWWYELKVKDGGEDEQPKVLRLRLAVLKDRYAAAKDLHDSLLQHGPGWWGVRRGNLALLAPKADLKEALRFALKYKLNCWGMFTYAGFDDAYVVTGSYSEF